MDEGDRRGVDRLTIQEAARRLGISEGAVRKRVTRKTLRHEKDDDGRVYVYLDTRGRRGVDAGQDEGVDPNSSALISRLESEVAFLRDQVHRQQEIIAQQAVTMRQLTAGSSQEATEDAETVEEAPEGGEPHSATEGAQEGTERPQQRSGWLAPVDRLPWWQYALGLSLVFAAGFLGFSLPRDFVVPNYPPGMPFFFVYVIFGALVWFPPGIFGFWVGYRRRNVRLLSQVVPLGALVGGVDYLGLNLSELQVEGGGFLINFSLELLFFLLAPAWLLFVSAALLGNTWQRRRVGRISGSTPASPVSRTTQGNAQQPRKDLTPAQQAILGWGGAIISALITLVGTIIAVRSGP